MKYTERKEMIEMRDCLESFTNYELCPEHIYRDQ